MGGHFGLYSNTVKRDGPSNGPDELRNGFLVMPMFGKAIKENLIAGWYLIYSYRRVQIHYSFVDKLRNYGSGFFMRKYKQPGSGFYLFTEANASGYRINRYQYISSPPL